MNEPHVLTLSAADVLTRRMAIKKCVIHISLASGWNIREVVT